MPLKGQFMVETRAGNNSVKDICGIKRCGIYLTENSEKRIEISVLIFNVLKCQDQH